LPLFLSNFPLVVQNCHCIDTPEPEQRTLACFSRLFRDLPSKMAFACPLAGFKATLAYQCSECMLPVHFLTWQRRSVPQASGCSLTSSEGRATSAVACSASGCSLFSRRKPECSSRLKLETVAARIREADRETERLVHGT
jgi:hypothetical protein